MERIIAVRFNSISEQAAEGAANLHWLAILLTGCRQTAIDATLKAVALADDPNTFFSAWMQAWSRRLVIAKALAGIRRELIASVHRKDWARADNQEIPPPYWNLDQGTTKAELERALLLIDVFPRAAVLLRLFERLSLHDTAALLDADPKVVREAQAFGTRQLTANLGGMQGWAAPVKPVSVCLNEQH